MKVYELMKLLGEFPANAEVKISGYERKSNSSELFNVSEINGSDDEVYLEYSS